MEVGRWKAEGRRLKLLEVREVITLPVVEWSRNARRKDGRR